MIRFDGEDVAGEFHQEFGKPITSIDERQMWWLVKLIKHCRGRCCSNAALNNYLTRNFKHLQFNEVDKEGPRGMYKGLEIKSRV